MTRRSSPPTQNTATALSLMVDPPSSAVHSGAADEGSALSDVLARQLRLSILRGELASGSRVNLDEMKGRFGVSLSPLREALSRLIAEGFVTFEAKRGFRVNEMSRGNLEEIVGLRRLIEPYAVEMAVTHGSGEWEERMAAALYMVGKKEAELDKPHGHPEWENASRKFSLALLSGSGMPMLLHFCSTLMDLHDRYRLRPGNGASLPLMTHRECVQLFDACVHRDAAGAAALVRAAIDRMHQHLLGMFAQTEGQAAPPAKRRTRAR